MLQRPPWSELPTGFTELCIKLLGLCAVMVALSTLLPPRFLSRPYAISHDTLSYTDVPGLSAGIGLSNFSSTLRTPGYSLFFALVSLGEIPRPDAIAYTYCGDSHLGNFETCEAVAAKAQGGVTVRADPVVYEFSQRTGELFQRTITASRILALLSLAFLLFSAAQVMGILPAGLCTAVVLHYYINDDTIAYQDILQTESLFPSVFFLYIGCMLQYIRSGRGGWLYPATLLAIYAFLVRPVFIYVPIVHIVAALLIAVWRGSWLATAVNAAVVAVMFGWFIFWSPVEFFSSADEVGDLQRTAVISSQSTVDCVTDPNEKVLLGAYLESIKDKSKVPLDEARPENYFKRYYDFAMAGVYHLEVKAHPIYQEPGIAKILNKRGDIPDELMGRTLASARSCNFWRNMEFSIFNVEFMLGLKSVQWPFAPPHYFFQSPLLSYVCISVIVVGLSIAAFRRHVWWLFLVGMPLLIYFMAIAIIALKQGGESRYSFIVEPLFVLSAVASFFAIVDQVGRVLLKNRSDAWTGASAAASPHDGPVGGMSGASRPIHI